MEPTCCLVQIDRQERQMRVRATDHESPPLPHGKSLLRSPSWVPENSKTDRALSKNGGQKMAPLFVTTISDGPKKGAIY